MSATQTPTCALKINAETLSNYRDAALSPAERERIAQHLPTCARCRARLAGYEHAAVALRAERVPMPDGRLWRGVRAEMERRPHKARVLSLSSRPILSGLGAVAAVLLLVVGFAQLLHRPPSKGTMVPLVWTRHALPQGVSVAGMLRHSLAVVDANDAYSCSVNPSGGGSLAVYETRIYVTHDRGAAWDIATKLRTSVSFNYCEMLPDMHTAGWALMVAGQADSGGYLPTGKGDLQLTTDGGKTWTQLSAPVDKVNPFQASGYRIAQMATMNENTFILTFDQCGSCSYPDGTAPPVYNQLLVSHDGMQTWAPVDNAITTAGQYVQQFWVGANGTLYAQTAPNTGNSANANDLQLWTSTDSGQTWTRLPAPSAAEFQVHTTGTAATLCALTPNEQASTSTIATLQFIDLQCSTDGGKTWAKQNVPELPARSASISTSGPIPTVMGYLDDGALLGQSASGTAMNYTVTLYTLEPGSQDWQSLGALPAANLEAGYASVPAPGAFWASGVGAKASTSIYTADYMASTTKPQGQTLAWTKTTQTATGGMGDFPSVAPVGDGTNAYACEPTQANGRAPAILVTHDSGATWTMINKVAVRPADACYVVADQLDPQTAVFVTGTGSGKAQLSLTGTTVFATNDGGQGWRQITLPPNEGIYGLATHNGTTYLLVQDLTTSARILYTSTDAMSTWSAGPTNVVSFWLEPDGTLYYVSSPPTAGTSTRTPRFYKSTDGGKTATLLPAPATAEYVGHVPLTANGQPTFCAIGFTSSPQLADVSCSADGGKTWTPRNAPPLPMVRDKAELEQMPPPAVIGVDNTGALIAYSDALASNGNTVYTLQRLPEGASAWESLGPLPVGLPAPGQFSPPLMFGIPSVLWSIPINPGPAYVAHYTQIVPGYPMPTAGTPGTTTPSPVNWQKLTPPPGFARTGTDGGPDVILPSPASPTGAATAYACTEPLADGATQSHRIRPSGRPMTMGRTGRRFHCRPR